MKASFSITTAPTLLPVTLEEAKAHLRILDNTFDDEITAMIERATGVAELYTNLSIMPQVVDMYTDRFPPDGWMEIRRAPIQTIVHVNYYDGDNALQTLDSELYYTDLIQKPARLKVLEIPTTYERPNAINIQMVLGYENAGKVPNSMKAAILMLIASFFENRGDEGHRTIPAAVWTLLNQHRVKLY